MKKYLWYLLISSCLFTLFPQSASAEETAPIYILNVQPISQVDVGKHGAGTAENNLSENTDRGFQADDIADANGKSTAQFKIEREEPIIDDNKNGKPDPGNEGTGSGSNHGGGSASTGKTFPSSSRRTTQQAAGTTAKSYPQTSEEHTNFWLKLLGIELLFMTNVFWLLRKEDRHAKN